MNKKIVGILSLVVVAAMLLGACAMEDAADTATPGPVVDNDAATVVAEVNGEPIYYDEYYEAFAGYCSANGIPEDDEMYGPIIQQMALDTLVSDKVLEQKLEELGYMDLSDEKMAEAEQLAQDEINYNIEYVYGTEIADALGEDYTDEEYDAAVAEYEQQLLDMYSLNKEDIIARQVLQTATEVANEDYVKDIAPTEDEIKAQYDEYVAQDKEELDADPTMFVSYYLDKSPAYYVPDGVRLVLHVLTALDDDTQAAIGLLRSEGYDDQADIVREEALAGIEEEAQELLEKLESGELDFEEAALSEDYSDDPGMDAEGYPVVEGTTDYAQEFTDASLALEEIGDMSGLVASDFGYHIIKYIGDETQGAVDYDSVHDTIAEKLKTAQQMDAWNSQLEQWEEDADIVYYEENM